MEEGVRLTLENIRLPGQGMLPQAQDSPDSEVESDSLLADEASKSLSTCAQPGKGSSRNEHDGRVEASCSPCHGRSVGKRSVSFIESCLYLVTPN